MSLALTQVPGRGATVATLAERLAEALQAKGYSDRRAAREIKKAGLPISHAYIGQLRKGEKTNPTLEHIEALATLLGVSVGWLAGDPLPPPVLTPEEERQREQIRRSLDELGVQNIAERMTGLSSLSIDAIAQMVEAMRRAERLDNDQDDTDGPAAGGR
jgi:transcriptional regulator with XRE-family HTH domain